MASTLKMECQVFLCIFQKNSAMATLGLKEMGKFLWEGREKGLQSSLRKCKTKSGIMKSGLDAMPLFLLDDLLRQKFQKVAIMYVPKTNLAKKKKDKNMEKHTLIPEKCCWTKFCDGCTMGTLIEFCAIVRVTKMAVTCWANERFFI